MKETMRAVQMSTFGGPEVLEVETVDRPKPGSTEVLVRTEAAGVNPIDTYVRDGGVEPGGGLPHTPGSDVAGEVVTVGEAVTDFEASDTVVATGLGIFEPGSYAEYVVVPAERLAHRPQTLSADTAAAGAMVFPTAWRALVDRGDLSVGDVVLIQGGAGGVGHAAIQIAAHAGATVVATARPADHDRVRDLGADIVVDYRGDLAESVRGAGVDEIDLVLETHADSHLGDDISLLTRGGKVVIIGEDGDISLSPSTAMDAKVADADVRFMSIVASSEDQRRLLELTMPRLDDGTFTVSVMDTLPFAEAPDAHRRVESGQTGGKLLLEP